MKKKLSLLVAISAILSDGTLAKIEVFNPWISPSTGDNALLFMKVVNTSNKPDELLTAHTLIASRTELHSDLYEQGKKVVQRVGYIFIPPEGNMVLTPDNHHIKLINVNRPLKDGDNVNVTLKFKSGENVNLIVPVKSEANRAD